MILNYDIFYRRFGVRRVEQLLTPQFGSIHMFQLPAGAIYHHAHGDNTKYGPVENDIAFRGITTEISRDGKEKLKSTARPIYMQHLIELVQPEGTPIKLAVQPTTILNQFHQQHRRFRRPQKPEIALTDTSSLMVYNYDVLPHLYKYPRTFLNRYLEWRNIEKILWQNIARVTTLTGRPQFVTRQLPKVLPALSAFEQAEKRIVPGRQILELFNSPEHLFLIELWLWLGKNRHRSLLNAIPREKLSQVNIVFQESGKWLTINLGTLNSWRKPLASEMRAGEELRNNLIEPDQFQRRGLRFLMSIAQLRTVVDPEITEGEEQSLDREDVDDAIKEFAQPGMVNVHRVPTTQANHDPATNRTEVNSLVQKALVMDVPDKPADTPESVVQDPEVDAQVNADLAEMERIGAATIKQGDDADSEIPLEGSVPDVSPPVVLKRLALDEAVMAVCNRHADDGAMTANQYRHFQKISGAYKNITAPDGTSLAEFITIPPEALKITQSRELADIPTVPDKSMLKSSLLEFDERYIEQIMPRDIAASVMAIQNAGIAVTNYEVEKVDSILGSYNMYAVRVTPVEGLSSTLRFKLPVVDADGTYSANGVKYRMRKQRGDVPIRKTAPDTVALTSYYGKMFIRRSEKKVNDYGTWLTNAIMAKSLDEQDTMVTLAHPNNVHDHLFQSPRLYSILAKSFRGFNLRAMGLPQEIEHLTFELSFDHTKRKDLYGQDVVARYEADGSVVCGVGGANSYVLINKNNTLSVVSGDARYELPSIEEMLGVDRQRAPVDFAVAKVSGDNIPLGVIIAYEIGLDNLITLLKANVRRVPAGRRLNLAPNEESIIFNDETLIIDRNDAMACMFLAGFNEYHRAIKRYNVHLFNKREVYLNVLESAGLGMRWLREIDLFYQMFIDPITRDLLIEMHEPTDMRLLLLRAGELLIHDDHPAEFDAAFLRIKGYERMAGAVYTEIVKTLRKHNGSPGKHRSQLDMNPYDVWTSIQSDPSKTQVSDINPINNLREKEAVTYNGSGGRNSRTMTKHTRMYHRNDMGTISSDTVDSSDVAINTYLSADPQLTSLRGLSRRFDNSTMGPATLLSSSALLAPGSDHDDPKRVNFVGIQQTHGVSCNGYHQMPTRTGYEQVIAQRTSDMFAAAALEDGTVVSVTPNGVIVEYTSGKRQGFEVGRRYGNAAGLTIPHSVLANVKVGQSFKKGHILTYNENFFEKDFLNPNNVVWKAGVLATVALMEVSDTLEDSSMISQRLADKLVTPITKVVDIVVAFDQSVRKLVKPGDAVNSEDILCIIEDAVTSNAGLFDEESLDTLRLVENQSPQAKVKGIVERIEVFYNGDKEDMSDSLRAIASASDRELANRLKSVGKRPLSGMVDEGFRVDGTPLPMDTLAIRVYLTSQVSTGEGDKGVFANQMKTVFGKNFVGDYRTESGTTIDAIFGQKSIDDRIVHSPIMIGTTNVLLELISKKAFEVYKS